MTLDQLMKIEKIDDYYIWWYGAQIEADYMNDKGFKNEILSVDKGAKIGSRVYIVLSGIDGSRSRYKFMIKLTECVGEKRYKWEKYDSPLDMYCNRLVFKCNRKFSFYNSSVTGKEFNVEAIIPPEGERTVEQFIDYESVELTFPQLQETISNGYIDYYEHLSCIKAVYMIIDGNTGKQYIGSAYEQTESLWTRWKTYANTYHGNNQRLIELYDINGPEYFNRFKYIILHIFPKKTPANEIIEVESKYKRRFMTREFGLNNN